MTGLANDLNISQPGYVVHNGAGVFSGRTFQAGTGITLTNADGISGNTTISSTASQTDLHTAKWIVNQTPNSGGNATSIASALASALPGETIFIMPGTYTENLTLRAGINLTAFSGDSTTPNVTIVGKLSFSEAGNVTIGNIRLQTNSDFALAVTGSSASIITLNNCVIVGSNNTAVSYTTSNVSSAIFFNSCANTLTTTGIAYFSSSGTGSMSFLMCNMSNVGSSTTASTFSAGSLQMRYCSIAAPITTSSTAALDMQYVNIIQPGNTTCLTAGGSGAHIIQYTRFGSGSASAISVSSSITVDMCDINSSNTNVVTGSGTIIYNVIGQESAPGAINANTNTGARVNTGPLYSSSISFDSGSNTLANYVQAGSFTPAIAFGGGTTGITYSQQVGKYTRVGNCVFYVISVVLTSKGSSAGAATLTNLPIAVGGTGTEVNISKYSALTLTANYTTPSFSFNTGASTAAFTQAGSGQNFAALADTNFANNTSFGASGFYFTS